MNKSESNRVIKQVEDHLETCFPDKDQRSIILGVSGGPDSMSLLYIFSKLSMNVTVVHCNYQLRGEESNNDQKLVEDTAFMWGFDTVSTRLDPEEAEDENFQNWARNRRYQIFRDIKKETGAGAIATAHHQDDQLETIIQKILRGAGMTAWQGMKLWDGELFRPLLEFSKAEILQFASRSHIPYRLDSSNEESTYARNFLRNGWFPILDDLFPGWRENILKVPERAKEHEALAKALIGSLMADGRSIMRERLIALAPEVQKPLILQIMKSLDEDIQVSSGALENLDKLESLQTGKKLLVNENWSLTRDRERFIINEEKSDDIPAVLISRNEIRKEKLLVHGFQLEEKKWQNQINASVLQLDADSVEWPLKVRVWKEGDIINPYGMEGSQKISDLLTNNKISATDKPTILVGEAFDGKICAVIFPHESETGKPGTIANWARCTPETDTMLIIRKSG
jgi:tRNA(Ile)-lysidine synthase